MKRVLATGVFDIIHPGHLWYFEEARKLGDELVVLVTSDKHASDTKRVPKHDERERLALVKNLRLVDDAFVGNYPYSIAGTVERARPDVIALGHDQPYDEEKLAAEFADAGHPVVVRRIARYTGTDTSTRDYPL